MKNFIEEFFSQSSCADFVDSFEENKTITLSGISNKTAKSFVFLQLISRLKQKNLKRFIWVAADENEVFELYSALQFFLSKDQWKLINFLDFKDKKVEFILSLQKKPLKKEIILLNKESLLENFPNLEELQSKKITFYKDRKINLVQVFNSLIEMGFENCSDLVSHKGEFKKSGDILNIFPLDQQHPLKIEIEFDKIKSIFEFDIKEKKIHQELEKIDIFPKIFTSFEKTFFDLFEANNLFIFDDVEDEIEEKSFKKILKNNLIINFISFLSQENKNSFHLQFLSVLKFFNLFDLIRDLREKISMGWKIMILTKRIEEIKNIFSEEKIPFSEEIEANKDYIFLKDAKSLEHIPSSFQNQKRKLLLLTDREIFQLRKNRKIQSNENINLEFLTSLKPGDFVVHADNGVGRFLGIVEKDIDNIKREFLEISYANEDKLFIPVDQADKVSRFIADQGIEPKLTRLGSLDWKKIQTKVKKETEKIAKELLKVQAKRQQSKGLKFNEDNKRQSEFEKTFPYEETPGQIKAILDVKKDMEKGRPMDRLICGDVGFGKTEVALRAAFKAVENGKQVAFISPVTILADQHTKSFKKRMDSFGIKIDMLSRFKSQSEQKKIIQDLKKGKIDIIIGTHRLLGDDIEFFNLGLLIIDEEQRFGVKQKEKFKAMRAEIDILTLSATPIPRTLNLALHKLRDITTITTPPPGRLPVMTEIRKYSDHLIKEAITREKARSGQVFFLHNRVETIDAIEHKLKILLPEIKFITAHGQLKPDDLENRIMDFKNKKFDVLISSTIIENGIDLPNANTLIVSNAEKFGLAQLYQLRGRIGRGKIQAFAYFLYHTQKLKPDAKKRLRAIVEASELGSGFQIAMKDLEIRGAGDILGVNQHGSVNNVGVHHFLKLLNETIKKIKMGNKNFTAEKNDVVIEIPINAFIPNHFIADQKEKILAYQQISSVKTVTALMEIGKDLKEEFGPLPKEVRNLLKIMEIKLYAREAKLLSVRSLPIGQNGKEIQLFLSKEITAKEIMHLLHYNNKWEISGEKLKTNVKNLGFNWIDELIKCINKLKKIKI